MIRFANSNDVNSIIRLFNECFPEELDFNRYFFDKIFDYKNTLLYIEDNKIVAMAQMLSYAIKDVGNATYIYGAATDKEYRNRGIMRELLKKSFEIDCKNGVKCSILIPASEGLFDFYGKLGYKTAFYVREYEHKKGQGKAKAKEVGESNIKELMNIYKGDIVRDKEYWETQINMYKALGGSIFVLGEAYAVVSDRVEEIMWSNEEDKRLLLDFVCDYLSVESIKVREKGDSLAFGMLKEYVEIDKNRMYMNLMYN